VPRVPGLNLLSALPVDLLGALRVVPRLLAQIESIAESTRSLKRIEAAIDRVAEDASVLPTLDERMAQIEAAMPTLVDVQQQLADLPRTMDELQERLGGVSDILERLLALLDTLDANVGSLRGSIEPIGRIADRLPGRR